VNIAGLHLLGQRSEFLQRMPLFLFIEMADRHSMVALSKKLIVGRMEFREPIEVTVRPPRRIPIRCNIGVNLVKDPAGEPSGFLWLMRDPISWVEKNPPPPEDINAMTALTERTAHEFRNVLAGIRIHADVVALAKCHEDARESLNEIRNGCDRAAGLLAKMRES
jgi:nitrogen-specific signal transduction histidine kinase